MGYRVIRVRLEVRNSDSNKSPMLYRLHSRIHRRPRGGPTTWELYVDGSSNKVGSGAGILLVNEKGTQIEVSLKFEFSATNNQVEYEVLIAGLKLTHEVGAAKVVVLSDSQVVTSQINGEYQAKDQNMKRYLEKTREYLGRFLETEVRHITRELNSRGDTLSKLASTKPGKNNRSLIQETLQEPSVTKAETKLDVLEISGLDFGWMTPLVEYLKFDILPEEQKEAKIRREAQNYTIVRNVLY
ncbi:Ribonuclease HI [Arachis hypogaea]|nr:Ribonuclease HI [Arachis hypogaea]